MFPHFYTTGHTPLLSKHQSSYIGGALFFRKVQNLADDDDDPATQSAAAWVEKMRVQDEEKKLAQKRVSNFLVLDNNHKVITV